MLLYKNEEDRKTMNKYYRTSDMIKLLKFFPDLSPIVDLTIIESVEDYYENEEYIKTMYYNRVDTLKTKVMALDTDNRDIGESFLDLLKFIKSEDSDSVLVVFNTTNKPSERYERYAGIAISVELNEIIRIEAVGKGFDGREVSKNMYNHERYDIPWFDLRIINIDNFKNYRTFLIDDEEYQKTRNERVKYLETIGYDRAIIDAEVPVEYHEIPDFIWNDVIKNFLKVLEKEEILLEADGIKEFAISGHTEGKNYMPWQMFDKTRGGI